MLVYMPTFGPSSSTPPRTVEPGTVTGPGGAPSTHSHAESGIRTPAGTAGRGTVTGPGGTPSTPSHAESGIRPPVACATTRSPCDCAYADTQIVPAPLTPTSLYGPT